MTDEEVKELKEEVSRLRQQASSQATALAAQARPPQAPPPPKVATKTVYTLTELQQMVDKGTISEKSRDDIIIQQTRDEARSEMQSEIDQRFANLQASQTITQQIEAYTDAQPDILKEGSPTRARVQEEYDFLISLGESSDSKATELKALRAAFGSPDKIKERRPRRTTHAETGGVGRGGADRASPAGDDVPAPLRDNAKLKYHYDALIQRGVYKGYQDPDLLAEMKYSDGWKPQTRGQLN